MSLFFFQYIQQGQHSKFEPGIYLQLFSGKFNFFLPLKTWKNSLQKFLIIGPIFFSIYCQPAWNQPKSHFLFHENVSLLDFYIMTLVQIEYYLLQQNILTEHCLWIPPQECAVHVTIVVRKVQQNDVHNELYFKEVSRYVKKLWLKSRHFSKPFNYRLQSRQSR